MPGLYLLAKDECHLVCVLLLDDRKDGGVDCFEHLGGELDNLPSVGAYYGVDWKAYRTDIIEVQLEGVEIERGVKGGEALAAELWIERHCMR